MIMTTRAPKIQVRIYVHAFEFEFCGFCAVRCGKRTRQPIVNGNYKRTVTRRVESGKEKERQRENKAFTYLGRILKMT